MGLYHFALLLSITMIPCYATTSLPDNLPISKTDGLQARSGPFRKALLPLLIGVVLKVASIIPAKLTILAFILSGTVVMAKMALVIAVIAALLQHSQVTQHDYKSFVVPSHAAKDSDWSPSMAASSVDNIVNSVSQTGPQQQVGPQAEPLTAQGSYNIDATYFPYSSPLNLNYIKRYQGVGL